MARHHKVHELLSREELDELESFAREPARTIDQCHDWLQAHGFTLSRGAVHNWKREFDVEDKFRASNEVARVLLDAAKGKDVVAISDAATLQLSQMLFEQLLKLQGDGEVTTKDLWGVSMALNNVVRSKQRVEQLQVEMAERHRQAIEEAEKTAKAGGGGAAVVSKVREILGIK
jgi:hypothetical protein